MTARSPSLRLLAALALGALVFAAGIGLARAWLPEWLGGPLPEKRFFAERFREMSQQVGIRLPSGEPRMVLAGRDKNIKLDGDVIDRLGPRRAAQVGAGLLVEVTQEGVPAGGGKRPKEFLVRFLPSGYPLVIRWGNQAEILKESINKEPVPSIATQDRVATGCRVARLLHRRRHSGDERRSAHRLGGIVSAPHSIRRR